jgi:hypothetical protein
MMSESIHDWDSRLESLCDPIYSMGGKAIASSNDTKKKTWDGLDLSGEARSKLIKDNVNDPGASMFDFNVISALQEQQADLMKFTIVYIERFRSKFDRLLKIKEVFDDKCTNIIANVENKLSITMDKISLQSHRLVQAEGQFQVIKNTAERDNQKRLI